MTTTVYGDQNIPAGVNAAVAPFSPGEAMTLRVRALSLADPIVSVPMSGMLMPIFRYVEDECARTLVPPPNSGVPGLLAAPANQIKDILENEYPSIAMQLQHFADRTYALSARVVESDDPVRLLEAYGVQTQPVGPPPGVAPKLNPAEETIVELNTTLNLMARTAATPLHGLYASDVLRAAGEQTRNGFFDASSKAGGDLDKMFLNLLAAMTFLRFATNATQIQLVTSITQDRVQRSLALASAFSKLASLTAALSLQCKLARIHALVAFVTSDLPIDAMRDEDGIRMRKAMLEKYAKIDGLSLFRLDEQFRQYYAARSINIAGHSVSQYNLPPAVYQAVHQALEATPGTSGLAPHAPHDQQAIPTFAITPRGTWAVLRPKDPLATRSELFDISFVQSRAATLKANDAIVDFTHAAVKQATSLIDEVITQPVIDALPGGLGAIKLASALLQAGSVQPIFDFGGRTINDPESFTPALMSGGESSLGANIDPANLKKRPLIAPVTDGVHETDIAALAGMYITGLPDRLTNIGAPQVRYVERLPVVPVILPTSVEYAKGNWPLGESQRFYELWSSAYTPHTKHPALTLDVQSLDTLIPDMAGYASLNILRRDISADVKAVPTTKGGTLYHSKTATALSRVGFLLSLSDGKAFVDKAGKPLSKEDFVRELFAHLVPGGANPSMRLQIARPSAGFGLVPSRDALRWPTSAAEAALWLRYDTVTMLTERCVSMAADNSWFFVPFTHVPPLLPLDIPDLHMVISAIYDNPTNDPAGPTATTLKDYRLVNRPGYLAHGYTSRTMVSGSFRPSRNLPWEPFLPQWNGTIPVTKATEWWPAGGIVHIERDVRTHYPFALRAGVWDANERHLLMERSETGLPKFRCEVPTGIIIMTDDPETSISALSVLPMAAESGRALDPRAWIPGFADPTKVSTGSVI